MSKIQGQNFRLFVQNAAVPESTNCSITINGNAEDTSTKDSEGMYAQESLLTRSWQATVESYKVDVAAIQSLIETFNAAQPVAVGWDQTLATAGTMNRNHANANFKRNGQAILNDLTFTFNDRATCTVSSQYQGTGGLE